LSASVITTPAQYVMDEYYISEHLFVELSRTQLSGCSISDARRRNFWTKEDKHARLRYALDGKSKSQVIADLTWTSDVQPTLCITPMSGFPGLDQKGTKHKFDASIHPSTRFGAPLVSVLLPNCSSRNNALLKCWCFSCGGSERCIVYFNRREGDQSRSYG
jgi:hypothetical protein